MNRPTPHCQDALRWLKGRGWSLAPLTGQDRAALAAIAHCWQLWATADEDGRKSAIDAVAALLNSCQEVCWPMARELIAHAGDWSHRNEVWLKVVGRFDWKLAPVNDYVGRIKRLARCHEGLAQVHP